MTKKTHVIEKKDSQHTQTWEWEETKQVKEALKELEAASKFAGNYKGPLYAPHPDLKNGKNTD
jgi:hypothetical protein